MSIFCDFRGRNERTHEQAVSSERRDLLHKIPALESPYLSQDSLCMDSCPTELRTVKFQLLSGNLQLGHSRLQQGRCGMKQVASKITLHPSFYFFFMEKEGSS